MTAYEYYMKLQGKENKSEEQRLFNKKKLEQDSINMTGADNNEGATVQTLIDEAPTEQTKIDAGFNNDLYYNKDGLQMEGLDRYVDEDKDSFNVLDRKDDISFKQSTLYDDALKNGSFLNQRETQLNLQTQMEDLKQQLTSDDPNIDKDLIQTKIDALNKELEDPSLSHMANIYDNIDEKTHNDLMAQIGLQQYNRDQNEANLVQGDVENYNGYWSETVDAFKSGGLSLLSKVLAAPLELIADKEDKGILGETLANLDDKSRNSNFYAGYNTKDVDMAGKNILDGWGDIMKGNIGHGVFLILKSAVAVPQVLAQSAPEMIALATANIVTGGTYSGIALATTVIGSGYAAENLRIAQDNNNGKELSGEQKAGILLGSYANSLIQFGAMEIVWGKGLNKLVFGNKLTGKKVTSYEELKRMYPEKAHATLAYAIRNAGTTAIKSGFAEAPAEFIDPMITNVIQKLNTEQYKEKSFSDLVNESIDDAIVGATLGFFTGKAMNASIEGLPKVLASTNTALANRLYRDVDFGKKARAFVKENGLDKLDRNQLLEYLSKSETEVKGMYDTLKSKLTYSNLDNLKEIENPQSAGDHLYNNIVKQLKNETIDTFLAKPEITNTIDSKIPLSDIINHVIDNSMYSHTETVNTLFDTLLTDKFAQHLGFQDANDLTKNITTDNGKEEIIRQLLESNTVPTTETIKHLREVKQALDKTPEDSKHLVEEKTNILNDIINYSTDKINDVINKDPLLSEKVRDIKADKLDNIKAKQLQATTEYASLIAQMKQAVNIKSFEFEKLVKEKSEDVINKTGEVFNDVFNTKDLKLDSLKDISQVFKNIKEYNSDIDNLNEEDIPKEKQNAFKNEINRVKKEALKNAIRFIKEKGYNGTKLQEKFLSGDLDPETYNFIETLSDLTDKDRLTEEDFDSLGSNVDGLEGISPEDIKLLINFIKMFKHMFNMKDTEYTYEIYKKEASGSNLTNKFLEKFKSYNNKSDKINHTKDDLNWIIKNLNDTIKNKEFFNSKKEAIKTYIDTLIHDKELSTEINKATTGKDLKNIAKKVLNILDNNTKQQSKSDENIKPKQSTTKVTDSTVSNTFYEDKKTGKKKSLIKKDNKVFLQIHLSKNSIIEEDLSPYIEDNKFTYKSFRNLLDKAKNGDIKAKSIITDLLSNGSENLTVYSDDSFIATTFTGKIFNTYKDKNGNFKVSILNINTDGNGKLQTANWKSVSIQTFDVKSTDNKIELIDQNGEKLFIKPDSKYGTEILQKQQEGKGVLPKLNSLLSGSNETIVDTQYNTNNKRESNIISKAFTQDSKQINDIVNKQINPIKEEVIEQETSIIKDTFKQVEEKIVNELDKSIPDEIIDIENKQIENKDVIDEILDNIISEPEAQQITDNNLISNIKTVSNHINDINDKYQQTVAEYKKLRNRLIQHIKNKFNLKSNKQALLYLTTLRKSDAIFKFKDEILKVLNLQSNSRNRKLSLTELEQKLDKMLDKKNCNKG